MRAAAGAPKGKLMKRKTHSVNIAVWASSSTVPGRHTGRVASVAAPCGWRTTLVPARHSSCMSCTWHAGPAETFFHFHIICFKC